MGSKSAAPMDTGHAPSLCLSSLDFALLVVTWCQGRSAPRASLSLGLKLLIFLFTFVSLLCFSPFQGLIC